MTAALHTTIETLLILLLIIFVVTLVARRVRIPYTIALVVAGLLGFEPGFRNIELAPDLILTLFLPILRGEQQIPRRFRPILVWGGLRGAASLALVLSIPQQVANGQAFPNRDLLQVMAFGVVAVSLLRQGLSMPLLIRTFRTSCMHTMLPRRRRRLSTGCAAISPA